ncbi:MAG: hypothetical protein QN755_09335, partial [Nitrososphaeraceae archaeon]|nr:hypothetical protein [Nitrososphaeraceae archaeon]
AAFRGSHSANQIRCRQPCRRKQRSRLGYPQSPSPEKRARRVDNDDGCDDGGDDGNSQSTVNAEPKNDEANSNNEQKIVSQVANQTQVADQTVDDKYGHKVFYILIKSTNNETSFVPDKVTLTTGSTIVWLNQDNSEHRITMGAESNSKYALLNSLILPNGMVDHEFQSPGTYLYSDLNNPKSNGVITILDNSEKNGATSVAIED